MKSGHSRSHVDPSEHLVTLVEGAAEIAFARDAPDDRGKGVLAVRFDGWTVMSTHVTGGGHGGRQLALLAGEASACAGPVVLVGDFNADAATVRSAFPTPFQVADPTGTLPTRVAGGGVPGQWIDHVVTRGARVEELEVVDGALRSDHNPVRALVVPS
jgi:endonuclease/exonuclease/phosphatase (EEP) superfamily protein YafD